MAEHNGIGADLREVPGGRTLAQDSLGLLKAATNFAKGKSSEIIAPAPIAPKAEPAAAKTAPAAGSGPSVIAINVEMTGSINSPDKLHVHGRIEGNVRAAALTICEGGSVKGEVVAETVTIHGTVEGRIYGQTVQLCAGAVVRGDIVHAALGIDTAAAFEGVAKRSQNPIAEATTPAKPKGES